MNLYGASGHAKVVIDILKKLNIKISNIFDDNIKIKELLGYKVTTFKEMGSNDKMIISVGNNKIRRNISKIINSEFGKAIHPNSVIDPSVSIEEGSVVMAGAIINSSAKIGKHCIINTASSIDHDCIVEDFVHISPNATLCGGVIVGEGTQIGAGAVIIPNIRIGRWCTIGAGAVIIKDVEDGFTVVGNPGRVVSRKN